MLRILQFLVSCQLLLVYSAQATTRDTPNSNLKSSGEAVLENNFLRLERRLNSNTEEQCDLKHCSICSENLQDCEKCEKGYKLSEKFCVTDSEDSTEPISFVLLIVITISLSLFSFVFCGL